MQLGCVISVGKNSFIRMHRAADESGHLGLAAADSRQRSELVRSLATEAHLLLVRVCAGLKQLDVHAITER